MAFNVWLWQNLTAKTGFNQHHLTIDLDTPQSFSSFTNTDYWHKPGFLYFLHLVIHPRNLVDILVPLKGLLMFYLPNTAKHTQSRQIKPLKLWKIVPFAEPFCAIQLQATTLTTVTTGHTIDRHLEPNIQKHCMSNPNKMFLTGILTNSWNAQLVPAIHGVRGRTHFRRRTVYPHTSTWALIAHQRYIPAKGFQETQRRWKWLKRFCVERNNGAAKGGRECHREMEIRKGLMGCLRLNNKLGVDCLSILRPKFSMGCALVYGVVRNFKGKILGLSATPASFSFVCGDFQIIYPTKYIL